MSIYRSLYGTPQCVVCGNLAGEGADPDTAPPLCDSCNTHGPGGAGWPAADSRDLRGIAPRYRGLVARRLGIRER